MALRSSQFRDSARLQQCLTSDAAHVTLGQIGDHVARIQSALARLRVYDPPDDELTASRYGPATAGAVLEYKTKMNVINRAYQAKPDNIVGKMTIASLDNTMFMLEGGGGPKPLPASPVPHPRSPPLPSGAGPAGPRAFPVRASSAFAVGGGTVSAPNPNDPFVPPLSDQPQDLQDVFRRSNNTKVANVTKLFPYIAGHEGPLSAQELSARFAANPSTNTILLNLHRRMKPFGIWANIKEIESVFQGVGSQGIFCEPFDHDVFLRQMNALTVGKQLAGPIRIADFCRDKFNVHGPRDSFREIVTSGPGLHICITQPAERANKPCDLHIDEVQQGQANFNNFCVPLANKQTLDHVKSVSPWLIEEGKKTAKGWFDKLGIPPNPIFF